MSHVCAAKQLRAVLAEKLKDVGAEQEIQVQIPFEHSRSKSSHMNFILNPKVSLFCISYDIWRKFLEVKQKIFYYGLIKRSLMDYRIIHKP